ncbi:helix-hairpin-helix domain-containing protein [Pelomonas sp. KK5]|uniref:ComEA family DNA-binding protein n=1 Tax=Pelomonas sp. KK5 TaxID=1855730 RepID=UPI00097C0936|nr:helix-hairpin-helix domain-containing protein [Pelomonas sp. KK5]
MRRRGLLMLLALPPLTAVAAELEINSASRAQLESLPGIGPALAERILAARAAGPFDDWADLHRRVAGIGPKLAQRLSDQGLRVNGLGYAA